MSLRITTDKAVYGVNEEVSIEVEVKGLTSTEVVTISVMRDSTGVVRKTIEALPPGAVVTEAVRLGEPGLYEVTAKCCGFEVGVPVLVLKEPNEPVRLAVVFHNHQPIYKLPNGHYHAAWAFHHTWFPEFQPIYDVGPYLLHVRLLSKYRVSFTYNLSPSMLYQWLEVISKGVFIEGGEAVEFVGPWDPRTNLVREAIDGYARLARDGTIEVLTSFIAHPISGYLIKEYGLSELIKWELNEGLRISKEALGVEPVGIWLPEMYFDKELVDIICNAGLRYTVLDAVYHLGESIKDRSSIYRPYKHGCLTILFRDTALSDMLSFQLNKASNAVESDVNARRFIIEVLSRREYAKGGVVTVALDGENWMILPTPNPYAALLLERIMQYLAKAQEDGFIRVVKPSSIINEATEEVKEIPTTSWLGSPSKWVSEREDVQSRLWSMARQIIEGWRVYEEVFGADEELRMMMAMALDSDFYWAEFTNPVHVGLWAHSIMDYVNNALNSITLSLMRGDGRLIIRVANNWRREASLIVSIESQGVGTEYPLRIPSNSQEDVQVLTDGEVQISLLTMGTRRLVRGPIKVRV
ncbi:glycoside hydrolase [Vulcanisaeta thermophila]|uniref:glycoside hydrolase n=1 Tax=Vulcanisaeta thermophila TaxID=867917 RepID=UPI000852CDB8|nr:glycoside hydrolase [Vulcanisaeta thermophila]